jgi:hypothetical protein
MRASAFGFASRFGFCELDLDLHLFVVFPLLILFHGAMMSVCALARRLRALP